MSEQGLRHRFGLIRAFYRRNYARIMADGNEWFGDAYCWDAPDETGITLSPIERALWGDIRAEDLVLYPQFPVGRFFVDFGNPVHKVAIECDGARWHIDRERDAARQREIEARGWTVYRISGRDCQTDIEVGEDENGAPIARIGRAREFIRAIDAQHRVSRRHQARRDDGWVRTGDIALADLGVCFEALKQEAR